MSKAIDGPRDARLVLFSLLSLTLTLILLSVWPSVAFAEPSFVGQYGNPTASGEVAIAASGGGSGNSLASCGEAQLTAGGEDPCSASSAGVLPLTGLLPDTGGPLLPLFALAVLASSFAGLLALRRLTF